MGSSNSAEDDTERVCDIEPIHVPITHGDLYLLIFRAMERRDETGEEFAAALLATVDEEML